MSRGINYHVTVFANSNDNFFFPKVTKSKRRSVVQPGSQSLRVRDTPVLLYI